VRGAITRTATRFVLADEILTKFARQKRYGYWISHKICQAPPSRAEQLIFAPGASTSAGMSQDRPTIEQQTERTNKQQTNKAKVANQQTF
jgi:hypothetical protein